MSLEFKSLAGDRVIVEKAPQGVHIGIIPAEPPFDEDVLDAFQVLITGVSVLNRCIRDRKSYSTPDGKFSSRITQDQCEMTYVAEHGTFSTTLDTGSTGQLTEWLRRNENTQALPAELPSEGLTGESKVGRNEPCPCGSGKKFKKCCIHTMEQAVDLRGSLPVALRCLEAYTDDYSRELVAALRSDPSLIDIAEVWIGAGDATFQNGNHEAATRCFQQALKLDPHCASARVNLAANLGFGGEYDEALQIIASVPDRTHRKEVISANIMQEAGRHEEAIALYEMAIEDEPDFYLPYARIVTSLKAIQHPLYEYWLEQGIRSVPHSAWIAYAYCFYLFSEGRYPELAEVEWIDQLRSEASRSDVSDQNADDPALILECRLLHRIARLAIDGDKTLLRETIRLAEGLSPHRNTCDIGLSLARLSAHLGYPEGIAVGFDNICEDCLRDKARVDAPLEGHLAVAHANNNDHSTAVELCEEVLRTSAKNDAALWQYWWSLDELDRVDEAIEVAERLAEVAPETPWLDYNLGYMCGKTGSLGKARHYYEQQIKAEPDHRQAVENLGFIQLLDGKLKEADASWHRYKGLLYDDVLEAAETDEESSELQNELLKSVQDRLPVFDGQGEYVPVSEFENRKRGTFEALRNQAERTLGSASYVQDLIATNNRSDPVFGANTQVNTEIIGPQKIIQALNSPHSADAADVRFQLEMQQKGDVSYVFASLDEALKNWRQLPESARKSLIEAEKRVLDGASIDHAPDVLAYAKTVEIAIGCLIFERYREESDISFQMKQEIEAVTRNPKSNTVRLASFVDKGFSLELGSMTFILRLCRGRTALRSLLVRRLRDFITNTLSMPELLEDATLSALEELARDYRNPAAHDRTFDVMAANDARKLAVTILTVII